MLETNFATDSRDLGGNWQQQTGAMTSFNIVVFAGDHCGPEVCPAALRASPCHWPWLMKSCLSDSAARSWLRESRCVPWLQVVPHATRGAGSCRGCRAWDSAKLGVGYRCSRSSRLPQRARNTRSTYRSISSAGYVLPRTPLPVAHHSSCHCVPAPETNQPPLFSAPSTPPAPP